MRNRSSAPFAAMRALYLLLLLLTLAEGGPPPPLPARPHRGGHYGDGGMSAVGFGLCVGGISLAVGVGLGIGIGALIFDRPWGRYGGRGFGAGVWLGRRKRSLLKNDEDQHEDVVRALDKYEALNEDVEDDE